ncbi:MAG: peptide-methionine (S)-S-oxide reductase MsrA [Cocleimonas sp.]|nr:peptide-methionine (S)-S-oxide reductase MsrA [Cocleimonas sp.]
MSIERAVLAGGCFWGMQDLIRKLSGVVTTRVGYTGDDSVPHATYQHHGLHAEAIEIEFDNDITTYRKILSYFFQIHDPSTLNRQGNDCGSAYRSEIFYTQDEQRIIALSTIDAANASGLWSRPVVTRVSKLGEFWEAEPEHQDYLERIPKGYTCHYIRPDWVFPER